MGKEDKKRSCWRKLCCCLTIFAVLFIAGTTTWYFLVFAKNVESPVGDCGGCYCIPDESTSFECPNNRAAEPQSSYPEKTHLNVWKSLTILNPYALNCNPFTDGVFCDTEPPLDPDFQWIKLGETAVCAVHFELEDPLRRRLYARRGEEDQSDIDFVNPEGIEELVDIYQSDNSTESEDENDFTFFENENEDTKCENSGFYRIKTYPSREEAESAGGFVTHVGNCGVCSTLQDLAVYASADFIAPTSPGNFCRRQAATSFENGLACYQGLGMTQDCAKIWADTSWNTARNCFGSCVLRSTMPQFGVDNDSENDYDVNSTDTSYAWYDLPATLRQTFRSASNETKPESEMEEKVTVAMPSNGPAPECAFNSCIECNDEVSAPTFERFAGRSRRRSGLLSTVARHCSSVPSISQDPCPSTQPLIE